MANVFVAWLALVFWRGSRSRAAKRGQSNQTRSLRYAHFEVSKCKAPGHTRLWHNGVTYLARDGVLNSTVALKVIGRKLAENPLLPCPIPA
jgi:hypothetical protein